MESSVISKGELNFWGELIQTSRKTCDQKSVNTYQFTRVFHFLDYALMTKTLQAHPQRQTF